MDGAFLVKLPYESGSLSPLPSDLRAGLTAVAVFASFSLVASTALFAHLTYKLVRWTIRTRNGPTPGGDVPMPSSPGVDLALGLAERHFRRSQPDVDGRREENDTQSRRNPNQFVILFYNLLLADMHQSLSFFLNAVWVGGDGIDVGTNTCWMQGWFVSNGDLACVRLFGVVVALLGGFWTEKGRKFSHGLRNSHPPFYSPFPFSLEGKS